MHALERQTLPLIVLALVAIACGPARQRPDGEDPDEVADASIATPDAGPIFDAGDEPRDAGNPVDSGTPDAGPITIDAGTPDAGNPSNHLPTASLSTPSGPQRGDVTVALALFDSDQDLLHVDFEYSFGDAWRPASTSSRTTGLPASANGVTYDLTWHSGTDLPEWSGPSQLRVIPRDPFVAGPEARSGAFTVNNVTPNDPPRVTLDALPATVRGDQPIRFTLADDASPRVRASLEWRLLNGGWQPLTPTTLPPTDFPADPVGTASTVTWASVANVSGNEPQVQVRVVATDGRGATGFAESSVFAVQNGAVTVTSPVRIGEVSMGVPDWFELVNVGSQSADLRGWKVTWYGIDHQPADLFLASPTTSTAFVLAPGARVVVTEEALADGNGVLSLSPNSGAPNNISWGNGVAGALAITDAAGAPVDFVRWEGSTASPPAGLRWTEPRPLYAPRDVLSLVRRSNNDTDSSLDFCVAASTRGAANGNCITATPGSPVVRLTEISGGADSTPGLPWVELVNRGATVDLRDWTLALTSGEGTVFYVFKIAQFAAGARLLVREGAGTDSAAVVFTGSGVSLNLAPGGGIADLRDPAGTPMDFLAWGSASGSPAPPPLAQPGTSAVGTPGTSTTLARVPDTSTTVLPSAWCVAFPTAGAAATACRPPPVTTGVRISEIADGTFDFFNSYSAGMEVQNTSSATVSLEDWRFQWNLGGFASTTGVAIGAVTLAPGQRAYFTECGLFGGTAGCIQSLPWGELGTNTGGSLELLDYTGKSVDFVRWGTDPTQPTQGTFTGTVGFTSGTSIPDSKSIGRREGAADTDSAADWCVQGQSLGASNSGCL